MIDFAQARRMMVDGQVRPSDVTDRALLAALLAVPRERFVPVDRADVAYLDRDIAVDPKRAILRPMLLARMIQAAQVGAEERALDVAGGTGYAAAILAHLAKRVTALEDDAARTGRCGELLGGLGLANVTAVTGPLDAGWPAAAPYDVILVSGAVEVEPHGLFGQLNEGGRLICVVGAGPDGKATLYRKDRGEVGSRVLFDAAAPVLPAFVRAPAFTF